ncbi:MAG TPA: M14 family zinc carboxypeptidase [Candidatus Krumholzibacteria bacterium]|nr:M14 family zinc carboxypeptidase [Candidatus Krumholzibacteria bacterium]
MTIPYKGPVQIQDLEAHGVRVIAFTRLGVDVEGDDKAMSYLMSKPWAAGNVVPQLAPPPGGEVIDANLGQYHTYDELQTEMAALVAAYPTLAMTINIGTAYAPTNRLITVLKISDNVNVDENEPEVLYMGNHHARELMSVEIPFLFGKYLLEHYASDPVIHNYVDTREIFIVPTVNPDGLAYVQANHAGSSNSWWRKNRRNNGTNFGVDLNRNYSYKWGFDNVGSSPTTSSDIYRGPSALSEPETQAIKNFCATRHFTCFLSYHSYGELLLYPWGYFSGFTPDQKVFAALGAELAAGTNYAVGNPALGTIYITNGDSDDWAYGETVQKNRIFGFTPEVNSLAQGGFGPAESFIQPTFDLLLNMNLTLLKYADNPYRVLGPQTPHENAVQPAYVNAATVNHISWTANVPADPNPVVSYDVEACLNPGTSLDTCTPALTGWVSNGFTYTASGFNGGGYNAGNGNSITHTLLMERPIHVDATTDTLTFKVNYSTESNYDYGYVDVSNDGGSIWTPLAGNITTNANPNGNNRGNGFTGSSGGFVSAIFPLTGYLGQDIQLRFTYTTDGSVTGTGIVIDNINPLVTCQSISTIAAAVVDTTYDHTPPNTGVWRYRVRAKDAEGQYSDWSNQQDRNVGTLTAVNNHRRYTTDMGANYPNPFNPSTKIPFVVGGVMGSSGVKVTLYIYDVRGARVATLVNEPRAPGTYVARWSGRDDQGAAVASGVYFARLSVAGASTIVRKLVLLK